MENNIKIKCDLNLPHLSEENKITKILHSFVSPSLIQSFKKNKNPKKSYWNASHFSLHKVKTFNQLPFEKKENILNGCSQSLLKEALFIEKSGLTYAAKMSLLSETVEEKMLYNYFSAEEATHYELIKCFLEVIPESINKAPFLELLAEIIEFGEKRCLIMIIQILLEGWGLTHYHALKVGCTNQHLKKVLQLILIDEAQHHRSGLLLLNPSELNTKEKKWTLQVLVRFFQMIQAGPQQIVSQLEIELGHLKKNEKIKIFKEMQCEEHSLSRINLLLKLIADFGFNDKLHAYGVTKPLTAKQCASLSLSTV